MTQTQKGRSLRISDRVLQRGGDPVGVVVDRDLVAAFDEEADFGLGAGIAQQDAAFALQFEGKVSPAYCRILDSLLCRLDFISMTYWILVCRLRTKIHFGRGSRFLFWVEAGLESTVVGVPARSRGELRRAS